MSQDRPPPDPRPTLAQAANADEAEPLPSPPPRTGPSPRRWLVELQLDDESAAEVAEELSRLLAGRQPPGTVHELDARRELPWTDLRFLALDTETTGLDPTSGRVIEVAWVLIDRGKERARFSALCHCDEPLPPEVTRITGIDDAMLHKERPFSELAPELLDAMAQVDFVAAYNAPFDRAFLTRELARASLALPDVPWVDPLVFMREVDRFKPGKRLEDVSRRWGVAIDRVHRALDDALATGELLLRVAPFLPARTLEDLLEQQHRLLTRQRLDERAFAESRPRPDEGDLSDDDQPPS